MHHYEFYLSSKNQVKIMIFREVMTSNVVKNRKKSQKIKQIDVNQNKNVQQNFCFFIIFFLNESYKIKIKKKKYYHLMNRKRLRNF